MTHHVLRFRCHSLGYLFNKCSGKTCLRLFYKTVHKSNKLIKLVNSEAALCLMQLSDPAASELV